MAIDASIDDAALTRAIEALQDVEADIIGPEFEAAGQKTVDFLAKDLRGGVASRSGELRAGISGEVKQVTGAEVEMLVSDNATHDGYNYGARLDKDGSLTWRSGKFKGRRTFGWFSQVLKRNAPKTVRRNYRKAVENVVNILSQRIG